MIELTKWRIATLLEQMRSASPQTFVNQQTQEDLSDSTIINGLIITKYHLKADESNIIINNYKALVNGAGFNVLYGLTD